MLGGFGTVVLCGAVLGGVETVVWGVLDGGGATVVCGTLAGTLDDPTGGGVAVVVG